MKRFVVLLVFIISGMCYSHAQRAEWGIGAESNYVFNGQESMDHSVRLESFFKDRSFGLRISGGYLRYRPWHYELQYFTAGVGIAKYFRPEKVYSPGIGLDFTTTFDFRNEQHIEEFVFGNPWVSTSRVRGIPLIIGMQWKHMFWMKNFGIEFGLGYRNTVVHRESPIQTFNWYHLHGLELSLGLTYLFSRE